jgi:hypothetical protein
MGIKFSTINRTEFYETFLRVYTGGGTYSSRSYQGYARRGRFELAASSGSEDETSCEALARAVCKAEESANYRWRHDRTRLDVDIGVNSGPGRDPASAFAVAGELLTKLLKVAILTTFLALILWP